PRPARLKARAADRPPGPLWAGLGPAVPTLGRTAPAVRPLGQRTATRMQGAAPVTALVIVPAALAVPEAKLQPAGVPDLDGRLVAPGVHRRHGHLLHVLP